MSLPIFKSVHTIENPDEIFLTKGLLKDKFIIWYNNMVKQARDISASQWVGPVLLTLLLGYNIYNNQQASARLDKQDLQLTQQHDLLIRLQTLKEVEDKERVVDKQTNETERQMDSAWRENLRKDFNKLEAKLNGNKIEN